MKRSILIPALLTIALLVSAQGCRVKLSKSESGGVWRSMDAGETWLQRVFIHPRPNQNPETIDRVDVTRLVAAPQDSSVMFLGTYRDGVYRSFNSGWSWERVNLGTVRVEDLAVDGTTKGVKIVYVAQGNRILRSHDAGASWRQMYLDPRFETRIFELAIDPFQSATIMMGTDDGRLLLSRNYGKDWSVVFSEGNGGITDILFSRVNKGKVFLFAGRGGAWKSIDGGGTWERMNRFAAHIIYDGAINPTDDTLFANTNGGLMVTRDGENWEELPLVTVEGDVRARSFTIHPRNPQIIYYGTQRAVYESRDGGHSWEAHELPTTRAANAISLIPEKTDAVFIGTASVKEEEGEGGML